MTGALRPPADEAELVARARALAGRTLDEVWRGEAYKRFRAEFRDYYLLGRRLPMHSRRTQYLKPYCASHVECGMTHFLCDDDFYAEADRRLERERRRPATQAWRLPNLAGRALIDAIRR